MSTDFDTPPEEVYMQCPFCGQFPDEHRPEAGIIHVSCAARHCDVNPSVRGEGKWINTSQEEWDERAREDAEKKWNRRVSAEAKYLDEAYLELYEIDHKTGVQVSEALMVAIRETLDNLHGISRDPQEKQDLPFPRSSDEDDREMKWKLFNERGELIDQVRAEEIQNIVINDGWICVQMELGPGTMSNPEYMCKQMTPVFDIEYADLFGAPASDGGESDSVVETYGSDELIERAIRNAKPQKAGPAPRWVAVRDTFAVGSTRAVELCREFDLDPEAQVAGSTCRTCIRMGDY